MKIRVEKGSLLAAIQDNGRYGTRAAGTSPGGALDMVSLHLANLLVQNRPEEGTLEIGGSGLSLSVPAGLTLALTGAHRQVLLDGKALPFYRPVYIRRKGTLLFGKALRGRVTYLAVAGGYSLPLSCPGRTFAEGDEYAIGRIIPSQAAFVGRMERCAEPDDSFVTVPWSIDGDFVFPDGPVRVVESHAESAVPESSRATFFRSSYLLSSRSDRRLYPLEGIKLEPGKGSLLAPVPLRFGSIQVRENGDPVIFMPDGDTVGCGSLIGQVILADLPRVAQCRPGEMLTFQPIYQTQAEECLARQQAYVKQLKAKIEEALQRRV